MKITKGLKHKGWLSLFGLDNESDLANCNESFGGGKTSIEIALEILLSNYDADEVLWKNEFDIKMPYVTIYRSNMKNLTCRLLVNFNLTIIH